MPSSPYHSRTRSSDFLTQIQLSRAFIVLFVIMLPPSTLFAKTWEVRIDGFGDAPTVQAGIDSAAVADTVEVGPGIFFESIAFHGKNIVVRSSRGPQQTTLDATGRASPVVTFSNGEGHGAVLCGFTITGGDGGIAIFGAEPIICNNVITNNRSENGGGVGCVGAGIPATPIIKNNLITNNIANRLGGGILVDTALPQMIDNRIEFNEATLGDGGGIYFRSNYDGAIIKGNLILGNVAGDHGGGIYAGLLGNGVLDLEISWNLVDDNQANGRAMTGDSGGGIWLWETSAWVHHNTIVRNKGNGANNAYGGGMVIQEPGSPIVEQNLIALSQAGGGILCGGGTTPTIRNNMAWQNFGGDGLGSCSTWFLSNGNVIDNPYFCDVASGDFTVASNSGAMTHPAGPLGAFATPGCGPVSVKPSTWGALKARYRSAKEL